MRINDLHTQDVLNRTRKGILTQGLLLPSCCIASAVIWQGVLENFGVKSEIVSTTLNILNPQFTKFYEQHNRLPQTEEELSELAKAGGRIVALGEDGQGRKQGERRPEANSWNGHLVVIAKPKGGTGTGYLVDLSIPQAHRPEKGINIAEPLVIEAPYEQLRVVIAGGQVKGRLNGCLVVYDAILGDASYHASPDWFERKARWSVLIEELTNAIREYARGVRALKDVRLGGAS